MLHAHARDETRSNCLFLRFLHRARVLLEYVVPLGNNERDARISFKLPTRCQLEYNPVLFLSNAFLSNATHSKEQPLAHKFHQSKFDKRPKYFARHCSFDEAIESNGSLQSRVERRRRVGESGATASADIISISCANQPYQC